MHRRSFTYFFFYFLNNEAHAEQQQVRTIRRIIKITSQEAEFLIKINATKLNGCISFFFCLGIYDTIVYDIFYTMLRVCCGCGAMQFKLKSVWDIPGNHCSKTITQNTSAGSLIIPHCVSMANY